MLALEYDSELARQAWIEEGQIKVAKNLLVMNFSINDIVKATGLDKEQILKLADEQKGVGEHVNCRIHL